MMCQMTIRNLIGKFEVTGSVGDETVPVRPRSAQSNENVTRVRAHVAQHSRTSILRRCQQLNITKSFLQRILAKYLNLQEYKIQLNQ